MKAIFQHKDDFSLKKHFLLIKKRFVQLEDNFFKLKDIPKIDKKAPISPKRRLFEENFIARIFLFLKQKLMLNLP